jgi:hypothetical protein
MVRLKLHVETANHNSVRRAKSNKQILEANCDDIITVVDDTREFRRNGKSGENVTCFFSPPRAVFYIVRTTRIFCIPRSNATSVSISVTLCNHKLRRGMPSI